MNSDTTYKFRVVFRAGLVDATRLGALLYRVSCMLTDLELIGPLDAQVVDIANSVFQHIVDMSRLSLSTLASSRVHVHTLIIARLSVGARRTPNGACSNMSWWLRPPGAPMISIIS